MGKSQLKSSSKSKSVKESKKEKPSKKVESDSSDSSSSSSDSSSDDSSDSSSDEEEEEKKEKSSDSSSDSSSESSSDSSDSDSSDDEEEKKEEKKEKKEKKESSSDSDSDSSDSDSSDSSDSDSDSEEDDSKKRKADDDEESEEKETKKAKTEEEFSTPAPESEPATLFVGRLSWSIDDAWLQKEFEPCGGVISARVVTDGVGSQSRSRGFGYVDFESKEHAEKALAEMQGKEIDGRPINVDMSTYKAPTNNQAKSFDRASKFGDTPSKPSSTLFIGNLPFTAERDGLSELFGEYGSVQGIRLPTNPETERPRGFGYVEFGDVSEATAALEALNGTPYDGRPIRLDYSNPRPNNDNNNSRSGTPSRGGRDNFRGGNRGGRDNFRGGNRGGRDNFRGGSRGGRDRPQGSGANTTPVAFKGTKKTFD